jgi:FkbM family methyltransferase
MRPFADRELLIVDVGANIGDTASIICNHVSNVRFICIEAAENYLRFFHKNTASLNVELIQAIAGDKSGSAALGLNSARGTASIIYGRDVRRMVTLDDVVHANPDLIKIDTDGFDLKVLRGARSLLKRCPHLFLEFSPYHLRTYGHDDPSSLLPLLSADGYLHMIVYDHVGYPMCHLDTDSPLITMLAAYVDAKPGFYVDLLVSKDRDLLVNFYQHDLKRFRPSEHF